MSAPKTSFQDFEWACGHTGPAVCKACAEGWIKEGSDRAVEAATARKESRRRGAALAEIAEALKERHRFSDQDEMRYTLLGILESCRFDTAGNRQ